MQHPFEGIETATILQAIFIMGSGLYGCACYTGVTKIIGTVDVTADTVAVGENIAKSVEKEENGINVASNSVHAHPNPIDSLVSLLRKPLE